MWVFWVIGIGVACVIFFAIEDKLAARKSAVERTPYEQAQHEMRREAASEKNREFWGKVGGGAFWFAVAGFAFGWKEAFYAFGALLFVHLLIKAIAEAVVEKLDDRY